MRKINETKTAKNGSVEYLSQKKLRIFFQNFEFIEAFISKPRTRVPSAGIDKNLTNI